MGLHMWSGFKAHKRIVTPTHHTLGTTCLVDVGMAIQYTYSPISYISGFKLHENVLLASKTCEISLVLEGNDVTSSQIFAFTSEKYSDEAHTWGGGGGEA